MAGGEGFAIVNGTISLKRKAVPWWPAFQGSYLNDPRYRIQRYDQFRGNLELEKSSGNLCWHNRHIRNRSKLHVTNQDFLNSRPAWNRDHVPTTSPRCCRYVSRFDPVEALP